MQCMRALRLQPRVFIHYMGKLRSIVFDGCAFLCAFCYIHSCHSAYGKKFDALESDKIFAPHSWFLCKAKTTIETSLQKYTYTQRKREIVQVFLLKSKKREKKRKKTRIKIIEKFIEDWVSGFNQWRSILYNSFSWWNVKFLFSFRCIFHVEIMVWQGKEKQTQNWVPKITRNKFHRRKQWSLFGVAPNIVENIAQNRFQIICIFLATNPNIHRRAE